MGRLVTFLTGQRIREESRAEDSSLISGWVKLLAGLPVTNVDKQLEEGVIAPCLQRPLI